MGFISELIGSILGLIMWPVYSLVKNYGIAIAIFTVIMRLLLFPLSVKQQKMVAANAAFAPKLEALKKKYANNPTKLQEEQMKLYAEENINPMSSCLPMFLQMFVLFGMIDVVYRPLTHVARIGKDTIEALKTVAAPLFEGNSSFSSRPELFILQSVKDNPSLFTDSGIGADVIQKIFDFDNMLFGIDLGVSPNIIFEEGHVWTAASVGLLIIPLLSGLIQIFTTMYNTRKQKKLNPESAAQMGSMNIMFYILPIIYVPLYFSLPAGISFYWTCSALVGLIQMVVLNKIYTPEYVQKLIEKDKLKNKNKKRSGFMEKYNELLQEQLKQQNDANNNTGRSRISKAGVSGDDEDGEVKLSNSQMKEYERKIIAEARRRQAEKYGGVYKEDDE